MATRCCPCGRELEESGGGELCCADCGPVSVWLVRVRDEAVAAGSRAEVFVSRAVLHDGLGLTKATLRLAASKGLESRGRLG